MNSRRLYEMNEFNKAEANRRLEELQKYCVKKGLEVPFWQRSAPPQMGKETEKEEAMAKTAVESAEKVLGNEDIFAQQLDFIRVPREEEEEEEGTARQ
jgi:hypothetical protein